MEGRERDVGGRERDVGEVERNCVTEEEKRKGCD